MEIVVLWLAAIGGLFLLNEVYKHFTGQDKPPTKPD